MRKSLPCLLFLAALACQKQEQYPPPRRPAIDTLTKPSVGTVFVQVDGRVHEIYQVNRVFDFLPDEDSPSMIVEVKASTVFIGQYGGAWDFGDLTYGQHVRVEGEVKPGVITADTIWLR